MKDFSQIFGDRREEFEKFQKENIFTEFQNTFTPILSEAVIYSLSAGGKRFRPVLVLSAFFSYNNFKKSFRDILYLASSVECIHTYSLIHDDLPSMDNDDFRRGLPTLHKKFSESTAILAGDALNSFGFYIVSKLQNSYDEKFFPDILNLLHQGSGGPGMVSGQIEDIYYEKKRDEYSENVLKNIHSKKTGSLITSSLLLGNRLKTDWKKYEKHFKDYGEKLGLLFQITDDILDEEGSAKELGKTPGKDKSMGKLTYPLIYGMEKSKEIKSALIEELVSLAEKIESKEEIFFKQLPNYLAERKN
ncbi:MAG: polyprenyl synthetase family protein [Leptospiraceae bacterium]|nr:polyprenyl synthetase family protein [Leptospiraceae bacterium]MCK6381101.1 polyprenyl synthetase family protein [Leptospiraceae bacterium]NUM40534.1 polyprenyl synthetase family protein [Leptospiraceae bacterium]